ncbi:flagellar basal-body rod protein FlgF [Dinoroseobacter shibae DFL 12 = DSM 16493]|jgi:flagellar basal-body rod protein FlgF|uniref:Flagellar basal-body rod protein FlgF n=1 Tax=Dinoroseobacter shibae (strain DSM 16493 / NCIMB 14021 / DFL 12) TaxID=398580 RepID=A8LMQ9_DINSH|nr:MULTISPECIES: flagellar hook-basal body complex protein [Dinoroseobacter]ABV94984.1 flagellar basal-body rod protein FlgF [Dinoroseobacter shibae DFL 12 = DSM 16493]MDD9717896.1 flagellar hook-basal body complex protein [Dinoroseobacter sp. PD6]URF46403.1 flagellar hook-basal body complex protein [Dinoroseobacter shibae]URF50709.1 flagellar hook-basal body complex protein [Dinoroseobacter shibae]
MDATQYTALSRQNALKREMTVIANNIANISTTGYRAEGLVFSEYVQATGHGQASISMTDSGAKITNYSQGMLRQTGGSFDMAIEGDGFFQVAAPEGVRLTRAGAFEPDANGLLVTPDGYQLLDAGGAPVFIPPDARSIAVAADGTLSADGRPLTNIGLVVPEDPLLMERAPGASFIPNGGVLPAENASVHQGFIEGSNVNPIVEVARMIEVQRRYESAKSFIDKEDDRIKTVIQTLGR